MKKRIISVFVSLLVVSIFALPMSAVYATKPTYVEWDSVTGMYLATPVVDVVGENTIIITKTVKTWENGDITGIGTTESRMIIHKDGHITTSAVTKITVTGFMGDAVVGTLVVKHGSIGLWRIISGTGDLANLHGEGEVTSNSAPKTWTFKGQAHLDP